MQEPLKKAWEDLRTLGDEIRVRLHLAGMEAKDRWNRELEPRLFELEQSLKEMGEKAGEKGNQMIAELTDAYHRFRSSLDSKSDGQDQKPGGQQSQA